MTDDHIMRRKPKQARSQQRVDHLIDTAAALFAEKGYDAVTTNAIAERAGVSIGSLYQFFPNKEALLDGLASRYVEDMQAKLGVMLSAQATSDMNFSTLISRMIDALAAFDASHAGFESIFLSASLSLTDSAAVQGLHEEIIQAVDDLLAARFPSLDAARRRVGAVVGVGIVKGLMLLAESGGVVTGDQALLEVKTALLAYVRAFLLREGHPLPDDLRAI